MEDDTIKVEYTNYRGEVAVRTIVPLTVRWSEGNEWHPNPGWELVGYDVEKDAERFFRLADCNFAFESNNLTKPVIEAATAAKEYASAAAVNAAEKTGKFFQGIADRIKK